MADSTQTLPTVTATDDPNTLVYISLTSAGSAGDSNISFGGSNGASTLGGGDEVIFYVSPEVEEQGVTVYIQEDSVRSPGSIIIWMGSPARTFSINAKFISRTVVEAQQAWEYKSLLQAWRMPTSPTSGSGVGTFSAPEIVNLNGYGNNFQNIPCIVKSVSFTYPIDVDYINTGSVNVPIIWPVSIQLLEYHTNTDMENFNYDLFKKGQLPSWN